MPMQLSVIRRGDTLNPMVVNVNINMADVKGIKTQFHLRSDDPRRGKHIIPVQQIVKLNTVSASRKLVSQSRMVRVGVPEYASCCLNDSASTERYRWLATSRASSPASMRSR